VKARVTGGGFEGAKRVQRHCERLIEDNQFIVYYASPELSSFA
jgi:hypothetical protein